MKILSKILLITSCVALSTQAYGHDAGQPRLPQGNYTAPEDIIAANPEFGYALPAQHPAARNIPTERDHLSSYASPQQAAAFLNNRLFMTVEELRGDTAVGVGLPRACEFRPIEPPHEDYDPHNYGARDLSSPTEFVSPIATHPTNSDSSSEYEYYNHYEEEEEEEDNVITLSAADQALSDGFKKALTDLIKSFYQKQ